MTQRLDIQLATGGTLTVLAELPEAVELAVSAKAQGLEVQPIKAEYYGKERDRGLHYTGPFLVRCNRHCN
jgi:hypothetical protein